ncbi:MAG: hypothetical protein CFE43_11110 [Burkholderiales bacterium PBB3]|nr:MAG: hypothetical protein CFE43_11110 [Burkholderiales bacterium PBB3]
MAFRFKPFTNPAGQLRNGWWVAIFMLVLAALLFPLLIFSKESGAEVSFVQQAGVVLAASVICQMLRRKPLRELLGAGGRVWPLQWLQGAGLGALLMLLPALVLWASGLVRFTWTATSLEAWAPALLVCAGVAVSEELMFRGFAFQRLIDGLGVWPAQLLIAAYFVLTHSATLGPAGALGYLAGANIFVASIAFGAAYLRTRSLAMPIGIHFAANLVQGSVLGFGVSGSSQPTAWTPALAPGLEWLTGGAFGLEASVPGFVCIVLLAAVLVLHKPSAMAP